MHEIRDGNEHVLQLANTFINGPMSSLLFPGRIGQELGFISKANAPLGQSSGAALRCVAQQTTWAPGKNVTHTESHMWWSVGKCTVPTPTPPFYEWTRLWWMRPTATVASHHAISLPHPHSLPLPAPKQPLHPHLTNGTANNIPAIVFVSCCHIRSRLLTRLNTHTRCIPFNSND